MGFYGNVTDTAKTTFSFDLVYSTRYAMDRGADSDGVFLGRYVLVDYDDPPIKGYAQRDSKNRVISFFNAPDFSIASRITPKEGFLYEDLGTLINTSEKFYIYRNSSFQSTTTQKTSYQLSFEQDVSVYGRGYDSTVWVKRYDPESGKYKYAMIAELNAVVPTLHLTIDKPTQTPGAPYFDRDTTNIDYYLHMQGDYGNRIKKLANSNMKSDEKISYTTGQWTVIDGVPVWTTNPPQQVDGDIYFNKAGFDPAQRTYSSGKVTYTPTNDQGEAIPGRSAVTVNYEENQINFDYGRSGRNYGPTSPELGVEQGQQEDDVYDWFIRLPGIGNAICKMWDKVYGEGNNKGKRYLNEAQTYEDTTTNLVTYDKKTLIGILNTARDLVGYHFIPFASASELIYDKNDTITVQNSYENGGIAKKSVTYNALDCIFYKEENGVTNYYCYVYSPTHGNPVANPDFSSGTQYYYKDETGAYRLGSKDAYKAKDANGNVVGPTEYYIRSDRWKLKLLNTITSNNIYTLICEIHQMLGTNLGNVRDEGSIKGSINILKDIIANIDSNLAPGKLMHTNNDGVIETTDVFYPSSNADKTKVLVGQPGSGSGWENRLRTVKVVGTSTNTNTWTGKSGSIDSNANNVNVLTLQPGNKWIKLEADTSAAQSVTIRHEKSDQAAHDFMEDVTLSRHLMGDVPLGDQEVITNKDGEVQKDCIFTFPMIKTDNAGHVIGFSTKTLYVPFNYRNMRLEEQSTKEEGIDLNEAADDMKQSAIRTNSTFNFATGNQWIQARIDEHKITFAHALANGSSEKGWEFKSTATAGLSSASMDGNKISIPTFETDKAGHVVRYGSTDFYIPNTYRKIVVNAQNDTSDQEATTTAGEIVADSTIDSWTLGTQNKWIKLSVKDDDQINIGHVLSPETSRNDTGDTTDQKPSFGGTFYVPNYKTDKAGHIIESTRHSVQLPQPSYSETVDKEVLTSLSLDKTTGAFTGTRVNAGVLKLGDEYAAPATPSLQIGKTSSINTAFSEIDVAITTEKKAREASDTTLQNNLNAETEARTAAIASSLTEAKSYTDTEVAKLVNTAPEALNTLNELAAALGNDENFATSVNSLIGQNTAAIADLQNNKVNPHIENVNNPHQVTKEQVGLGNVENENKATMFTNPAFTGVPTAPTADVGTATTQIATTEFVVLNTDDKIKAAVNEMLLDLLTNYGLVLNPPSFTIVQDGARLEVILDENQAGDFTYIWYKKLEEGNSIPVAEAVPVYEATEAGDYECIITRTYNNQTSTANHTFTVLEDVFAEPEAPIEPEVPVEPEEPTNPEV